MNERAELRRRDGGRRAGRGTALAAVLGVLLATGVTHAAPPSRAAKLFQEGKALLARGEVAEACTKLEESDAAEPSVGTLGLLAACLERQGKLASAWTAYMETAERARRARDDRGPFATERAAALEPRLPRLVVSVSGVPEATVTVGSRRLGPDQLDVPIFVDPGPTAVEAIAPDGRRIARSIDAEPGRSMQVELAFDEPRPTPSSPGGAVAPAVEGDHAVPVWPAYVGLGLAGAGATVMGVFGAVAVSRNATSNDLEATCEASGAQCSEGAEERAAAQDAASIANVGLAVGLVGLATSATFFILHASTGPGADEPDAAAAIRLEPLVSPHEARLGVRGAF